jgi:YggT family protein
MQNQIIHFLIFFVTIFAKIYYWAIFIYILMSWFPRSGAKFRRILAQIVEPILKPFRWVRFGSLDFSAIIAFIAIDYLGKAILMVLISLL